MNSGLSGKDTDAGKKLKAEKKRMAEDEMVGWHHQFNEHEFGDILGDGRDTEAWYAVIHVAANSGI